MSSIRDSCTGFFHSHSMLNAFFFHQGTLFSVNKMCLRVRVRTIVNIEFGPPPPLPPNCSCFFGFWFFGWKLAQGLPIYLPCKLWSYISAISYMCSYFQSLFGQGLLAICCPNAPALPSSVHRQFVLREQCRSVIESVKTVQFFCWKSFIQILPYLFPHFVDMCSQLSFYTLVSDIGFSVRNSLALLWFCFQQQNVFFP